MTSQSPISSVPASGSHRRVLVVGKFYTEAMGLHIAETLEAMGHTVARHEFGLGYGVGGGRLRSRLRNLQIVLYSVAERAPSVVRRRFQRLQAHAQAFGPDVILATFDYLLPAEVEQLKRATGAAVAMWFPDHIASLGRMAFLGAPYDAMFFKDPYTVERLRELALAPVHYLPEAFNPARHTLPHPLPADTSTWSCDLTTAGNLHGARVAVFRQLLEYDIKIWGAPLPAWQPARVLGDAVQNRYVAYGEKALAFRGAKIVVNSLYPAEVDGTNVRTFEAAGIGAFQLVEWRPALDALFVDGHEVVAYRGMADLRDKIEYYLPREDERRVIAEAGQARAHAEHTYAHRLTELLACLENANASRQGQMAANTLPGEA